MKTQHSRSLHFQCNKDQQELQYLPKEYENQIDKAKL